MNDVDDNEIKGCDAPDGCGDPNCGWCSDEPYDTWKERIFFGRD